MRCSRLLVRELPVLLIIAFAAAACSDATVLGVDDESRPEFASTLTRGGPVLCPTARTRTASAVIGRRGGTVALDGHRVTLPPGAVRRPTKITLTAPASRYLEIDLRANEQDHYSSIAGGSGHQLRTVQARRPTGASAERVVHRSGDEGAYRDHAEQRRQGEPDRDLHDVPLLVLRDRQLRRSSSSRDNLPQHRPTMARVPGEALTPPARSHPRSPCGAGSDSGPAAGPRGSIRRAPGNPSRPRRARRGWRAACLLDALHEAALADHVARPLVVRAVLDDELDLVALGEVVQVGPQVALPPRRSPGT